MIDMGQPRLVIEEPSPQKETGSAMTGSASPEHEDFPEDPDNALTMDIGAIRSLPCENCPAIFTDPSALQDHVRKDHTGARAHACTVCGKTFATSSGLKQHQHIHSSVKPFQCEVCLKSYTQFSNLCRHKRMHADCRQQIKCTDCNQVFSTTTSLGKHKRFCEGAMRSANTSFGLPSPPVGEEKMPTVSPQASTLSAAYMNLYSHHRPAFPFANLANPLAPAFPMFPATHQMFGLTPHLLLNRKPEVNSLSSTPEKTSLPQPSMAEVKVIVPKLDGADETGSEHDSEGEIDAVTYRKPQDEIPQVTSLRSPVAESTPVKHTLLEVSKSDSGVDEPFDLSRSGSCASSEDEPLDLSVKSREAKVTPRKTHIFGYSSPHSEIQKSLSSPPLYTQMKLPLQSPKETRDNHVSAFTAVNGPKPGMFTGFKPNTITDNDKPNLVIDENRNSEPNRVHQNKSTDDIKKLSEDSLAEANHNLLLQRSLAHARMMSMSPMRMPMPYMGGMYSQDYKGPMSSMPLRTKDRYGCRFCGKVFPRSANLTRHLRTHTGEQPYKCEYCERSFSISSNLQRHVRNIHNKEKPYRCHLCDRCFGQQTNLDRHLKKHETHPNMPDSPSQSDSEASPPSPLDEKEEGYVSKVRSYIESMNETMSEQESMREPEDDMAKEVNTGHHMKYYNAVSKGSLGEYSDEEESEPPTKKQRFISLLPETMNEEDEEADGEDNDEDNDLSALYGAPPGVTVVIPMACST